jgi:hypothetical protein
MEADGLNLAQIFTKISRVVHAFWTKTQGGYTTLGFIGFLLVS